MLKITRVAWSNQVVTLQLDGRVAEETIELLSECTESVMEEGVRLTLDLENVSFIDCEGLAFIKSLMGRGVQQINAPLFVAEQLRKCEAAGGD